MQDIFNSSQWFSEPIAYWTIQYEYKRSGADMLYRFYWKVWLRWSTSWYNNGLQLRLFLNGVQHNVTIKGYADNNYGWSYDGTTEWYTVAHKTSGTTPFYASIHDTSLGTTRVTSSSYSLSVSPCGATLLTAPDFTDEQNPTITYTNPAGNNVSSLQACISFDSSLDDIKYRDVTKNGSSYTFVLTEEERNVLRNGTEGKTRTVIFFLTTVIDGATFYSTLQKTLSIVNGEPTFTESQVSYTDANKVLYAITGNATDNQRIVQNQSSLSVTFGQAVGNKGATISQYILELNGVTKTATEAGTVSFGTINSSQDVVLKITAKDSRGYAKTVEKTITILAWSLPTFTAKVERLNNYEDETYLTVDASISSVDGINTIKSITYEYMEAGGSYNNSAIPIENNTKYTIQMDKEKEFFFLITVEDAFDYDTKELYLPKGKFPLFIDTEKQAVGINEFPEGDEALRVAGGVGRFDDGIMLLSPSKRFLLSIDDSGTLKITEIK